MIEWAIIIVLASVMGIGAIEYAKLHRTSEAQAASAREATNVLMLARQELVDLQTRYEFMRSERDALFAEKSNLYLPEGVKELMDVASPIVQSMDTNTNSGEWKYHQAYALMLKQPEAQPWVQEKWKIGLAIHLALATQRVEQS